MFENIKISGFYGMPHLSLGNEAGSLGKLGKLNVIIGENASGKTGLLKLLYAIVKASSNYFNDQLELKPDLAKALAEKLDLTFLPRNKGLADLVTKGESGMAVEARLSNKPSNADLAIKFKIGAESRTTINLEQVNTHGELELSAIFLPAKEVLTLLEAISYTREQHKIPNFDDTYYDLVKALRVKTVQGKIPAEILGVSKTLEALFEGKVVQSIENGTTTFIYKNGNSKYTMHQTAEGIKKIGILTTLINNRLLNKDTILFVDEPETALHPMAQRTFVRILHKISHLSGAQVFIATHSYYILNQVHIVAMENSDYVPCLSIVKGDSKAKQYEYFDLGKELPHVPIMKEALDMQSEELEAILTRNKKSPKAEPLSEQWT